MSGPEHFRKAEDHLEDAVTLDEAAPEESAWHQRQAEVHATLALAAATALNDTETDMPGADWAEWREVAGTPAGAQ